MRKGWIWNMRCNSYHVCLACVGRLGAELSLEELQIVGGMFEAVFATSGRDALVLWSGNGTFEPIPVPALCWFMRDQTKPK